MERIPAANRMVVLKVAKGGDILGQTCQRYVVKCRLSKSHKLAKENDFVYWNMLNNFTDYT